MIKENEMSQSEKEFWSEIRQGIVGQDLKFENEYGKHDVLYTDWIASGRLYAPIEKKLLEQVGPFVANPHSYSSYTGAKITAMYKQARVNIKKHVNAGPDDVLVTLGSGMSAALLRFQDILGIRKPTSDERPVVFITHMEHHSNQVSWLECNVDVVVVPASSDNLVSAANLRAELKKYSDRKIKIGAFSAGSNVTGIINPVHELAKAMHEFGGYCFADYAATAPYVEINMHPADPAEALDAICFSPHKFLGGPGSCGVLVFDKKFHDGTPKIPGGGNVRWTDPWGGYGYTSDIEAQEDGGTPGFIQVIKASMAMNLKDKMDISRMHKREKELLSKSIAAFKDMPKVKLLAADYEGERIGALAFNIDGLHYNMAVRLLNDRFGIQTRGGWSCASTYAYHLFGMDQAGIQQSNDEIDHFDATNKPGWVRLSLHPTLSDEELDFCLEAIRQLCVHGQEWSEGFVYNPKTNEFDKIGEESSSDGEEDTLFNC